MWASIKAVLSDDEKYSVGVSLAAAAADDKELLELIADDDDDDGAFSLTLFIRGNHLAIDKLK